MNQVFLTAALVLALLGTSYTHAESAEQCANEAIGEVLKYQVNRTLLSGETPEGSYFKGYKLTDPMAWRTGVTDTTETYRVQVDQEFLGKFDLPITSTLTYSITLSSQTQSGICAVFGKIIDTSGE